MFLIWFKTTNYNSNYLLAWDKGIGWRDIEVINTPDGRPAVRLHSKAKDIVQSKNIFLSISYAKDIAVACAVLEGANELSHSNPCL